MIGLGLDDFSNMFGVKANDRYDNFEPVNRVYSYLLISKVHLSYSNFLLKLIA